jgi:hypothetical protein
MHTGFEVFLKWQISFETSELLMMHGLQESLRGSGLCFLTRSVMR